ncbi:unnamed protein product [Phaedon cochleariae]|uniref:Solute carrier family 25 member 35 n=1 Tax=Phaedon cochleariae TaxID=80249 RepID=A0A9N9SBG4_PHACE|nr:unnamed protein product [Phaedon cochleariae]
MDFITGGLAAGGASIFSNPFDVVKTRMQLQGELVARGTHQVHYRNVAHAGWVIFKNEGFRGLQKGLSTAILMHMIRNSTRLGIYQTLYKNGHLTNEKGKTIFHRSACASAFSGAAGAFLGSPFFLVKTQLQSQSAETISVGTQHGHKGALAAFNKIYSNEGFFGLWRGVNAVMLRAVVGSSAQLTSFAMCKDLLAENDFLNSIPLLNSFVSSIISGVFQCLLMNPFDLVSVRLYNQAVDKHGKGLLYDGLLHAFVKIYRSEGVMAFYKGVGANYMRLAPHGALCLVFWDVLKDMQAKYWDNKL